MSNIGENIKKIRKEKGYSQKQLAEKLGTTPQNLAQYENGKRLPKLETLEKIANALDCEVSDIDENIFVIKLPKYELTPKRLERIQKDTEAQKLIQKQALGENITEDERQKISDYFEREKEVLPRFCESIEKFSNVIDKWGENILIDRYRKLNNDGKKEAVKRIDELTEIPRYTEPDEPPQE